ncbi:hypothetical protein DCAR_0622810 [Daucus carota subsp. sativus]|uniref:Uncharacterized protein n=1 Tax=Daucus carota subsp. sativus TaxID=79200 RepID=A0A164UVX2_DAUCS|nr:hypothetical protein DCAR_0622810 [Daucus carota subsp. sativus]
MRKAFLAKCAAELRVYYNYDCDNEIGDVYVRSHIQSNLKNQLSKEKKRADERVKIARSLGYTHATRRMLKTHYFGKVHGRASLSTGRVKNLRKLRKRGRKIELDSKFETPITNLEFFKYVYNIDEPIVKNIVQSLEDVSNSQPAPKAPLSPARLLGKDEAARLNSSQPTDSSTTTISKVAYSIIGKVLAEVTTTVRSLDGMDPIPRSRLNEMLEKLATAAFPDRTDPV